jgi:hypothetical protein
MRLFPDVRRVSGRTRRFVIIGVTVSTAAVTLAAVSVAQAEQQVPPDAVASTSEQHLIVFRDAPLATYQGERTGLPAPPRVDGKVDPNSSAARAYVADLARRQRGQEAVIAEDIGHPLDVSRRMQHAINAVVTDLTAAEAKIVEKSAGVLLVEPYQEFAIDTDAGPQLIDAPSVWSNGTGLPPGQQVDPSGPAKGEGIVFGIIDTGINFGSPSFAATDSQGFTHTNPLGAGTFLGTCAPGGVDAGRCNDKLIGGHDFVCGPPGNVCGVANIREEPGFGDTNGHGSHTGSIAAGNHRDVTFRGVPVHISGVAPRGNIVAYDVCYTNLITGQGLCPNVSSVAAVNQAIADGVVDVLNFSIGGGATPWSDAVSLAFLNATEAGIYVAASAGNAGPGAGTLSHTEPWVGSSAAATHTRAGFEFFLRVTGPAPVPAALESILLRAGADGVTFAAAIPDTTPLVVSPGISSTNDACAAFPAGTFANAIAVVRRGTCAFSVKVNNAQAAGAIAVVIANNQAGVITPSVPGTSVPAFLIAQTDGDALRDFAAAHPGATTAGIGFPATVVPGEPDVLADFSSRGPTGFDLIKPDVTAPGVEVLAAVSGTTLTGSEQAIGLLSGTSMASPHHAGAAGLLRQLHPSWSVAEIKSALGMTADTGVLLEDGVTPADPFAQGSGRVEAFLAARAGLVLDETTENYLAADPATGGDPAALNLPSLAREDCTDSCTFTRTFRSTRKNTVVWNAALSGLPGTVTPSQFTLKAGATQTVQITIDGSALVANNEFNFGAVVLSPNSSSAHASPPLRLPAAIAVPPPPMPLQSGVPVTDLSGPAGSDRYFTIDVPSGSSLLVTMSGGTGDADLFVRFGDRPTDTEWDCRPFLSGNNETCSIPFAQAGTWWLRLNAFTAFAGVTLTATVSPAPVPTALVSGVPVTGLSGAAGSDQYFTLDVPSGSSLLVTIAGGTGDADLFVRFGAAPTNSQWDCRPFLFGNNETCTITFAQAGTWWIRVNAFSAISGVTLTATASPAPTPTVLVNGVAVTDLSGAAGSEQFFTLQVPSGASSLVVTIAGGTGDADMYVRLGAAPTDTGWDCRPFLFGNNETCTISSPQAGTWWVRLKAFTAFTGVTLVGTHS